MKFISIFIVTFILNSCSDTCNRETIQDFIKWKSNKEFNEYSPKLKQVIINYYSPVCFNDLILTNEVKTKSMFALKKLWENDKEGKDLDRYIHSLEIEQESKLDRNIRYYKKDSSDKSSFIQI